MLIDDGLLVRDGERGRPRATWTSAVPPAIPALLAARLDRLSGDGADADRGARRSWGKVFHRGASRLSPEARSAESTCTSGARPQGARPAGAHALRGRTPTGSGTC